MGYLIALGALVVLGPFIARLGQRHGRAVKRGAGMALIMLGFGEAADPPKRHLIEAIEGETEEAVAAGEPKDRPGSG